MILDITIQADSDNASDMTALAALIASLGGRVGTGSVVPLSVVPNAPTISTSQSGTAVQPTPTAPTPAAPDQEADETEVDPAVVAGAPAADSAGIPWDARIHSESRATIADGTWRKRRNVPQDVYGSVLAELSGAHPTSLAVADVPPPPAATTNDTPEPPVPEPVVTASAAVAATTAADVPPPPASGDGPDMTTWPKFVQAVQAKPVAETSKTYDALNELSATFGAAKFLEMKDKSAQWPMFYDMVG